MESILYSLDEEYIRHQTPFQKGQWGLEKNI